MEHDGYGGIEHHFTQQVGCGRGGVGGRGVGSGGGPWMFRGNSHW